jgi:hypothetical protein
MSGRHSGLSSAPAFCFAACLLCLLGACATSATNTEHGPSYGQDAGDGATSDGTMGDDSGPSPESSTSEDSSTPVDSGTPPDSAMTVDSGTGASDTGTPPTDSGSCSSTMALLAMGGSALAEATFSSGTWSAASLVVQGGAAAPALPVLVPFSSGYLGAFVTSGAQLDWTAYTGSWSAPAPIGTETVQGTPALAVTGSTALAVYWAGGGNDKFFSATYAGGWDTGNDLVEPDGGAQSFGSSGPAAAGVGSAVVAVQAGTDSTLYDQTWTAGAWQAASGHTGSAIVPAISPAIVALQGGTADLMIVYVGSPSTSDYLMYTTRTGGTWSTPAQVYDSGGNIAYTGFTPTLAALPNGGAIVVWQGGNNMPYESTYTAGTWAAPVQVASTTVMSPPAVAQGVCGSTAIVGFVQTGGQVQVTSLSGSTWSSPTAISGATGMVSVALASTP